VPHCPWRPLAPSIVFIFYFSNKFVHVKCHFQFKEMFLIGNLYIPKFEIEPWVLGARGLHRQHELTFQSGVSKVGGLGIVGQPGRQSLQSCLYPVFPNSQPPTTTYENREQVDTHMYLSIYIYVYTYI